MTRRAVMGVGCRSGVAPDAILHAVRETLTLALVPVTLVGLHTASRKASETGLCEAAACLGLSLTFHDDHALRSVEGRIASPSQRVARLVGVASVAEAAALLGAGEGAALLAPKHSVGGVSCAIAVCEEVAA